MNSQWVRWSLATVAMCIAFVSCAGGAKPVRADTSVFVDPRLERAVAAEIGGEPRAFTVEELQSVVVLDASASGIRSLLGIESLSNLEVLNLEGNPIRDASPLARLSRLRRVNLRNTEIVDIGPVLELQTLKVLFVSGSPVELSERAVDRSRQLDQVDIAITRNGRVRVVNPVPAWTVDSGGPTTRTARHGNGPQAADEESWESIELLPERWVEGVFSARNEIHLYTVRVEPGVEYALVTDDEFGTGKHFADPEVRIYDGPEPGDITIATSFTNGLLWDPLLFTSRSEVVTIAVTSDNPGRTTYELYVGERLETLAAVDARLQSVGDDNAARLSAAVEDALVTLANAHEWTGRSQFELKETWRRPTSVRLSLIDPEPPLDALIPVMLDSNPRSFLGADGLTQATRRLGPPTEVIGRADARSDQDVGVHRVLSYAGVGLYLGPSGSSVKEVRCEGYETLAVSVRGITVGATAAEVVEAFPEITDTVEGKINWRRENVLYFPAPGPGLGELGGYVSLPALGLRMFLVEGAVIDIYLYAPEDEDADPVDAEFVVLEEPIETGRGSDEE